jgi:hypothetical protein
MVGFKIADLRFEIGAATSWILKAKANIAHLKS